MARIIVTKDRHAGGPVEPASIVMDELVVPLELNNPLTAQYLIERLAWALDDSEPIHTSSICSLGDPRRVNGSGP